MSSIFKMKPFSMSFILSRESKYKTPAINELNSILILTLSLF